MASILIIDDNVAFGESLVLALRSAGHTVWHGLSGKAGFKLLNEHPVDLVITDIVMPDQDGLEVVMQLKKSLPRMRVILMSGDSPRYAPLYLSIGRKLGVGRTLLKPFSIQTLLTTVAEVLGGTGAVQKSPEGKPGRGGD